jgi:hypothetical protein
MILKNKYHIPLPLAGEGQGRGIANWSVLS